MLTLLAVFSGVIVVNNVKLANKKQNQPQATDYSTVTAYDFAGGRIEDIDDIYLCLIVYRRCPRTQQTHQFHHQYHSRFQDPLSRNARAD